MANLKPAGFIKEALLKEAIMSPEIKPGVIIVYNSSHYVVVKMYENSLGWVMYCFQGKPEARFEKCPGGVFIPFGDDLYNRPAYLPTTKSLALVKEIERKIQKAREEYTGRLKTGAKIPAEASPTEIVQFALDGKLSYNDAIYLLKPYNPRHLVRLSRTFGPSYKVEETLIKNKESLLLADYAIRTMKKRMSSRAEDVIKLNPEAWKMYTINLPN